MKVSKQLLFVTVLLASLTSHAMKISELPAGSKIKFYDMESIPAGWEFANWDSVALRFSKPLPNILDLTNTEFVTEEAVRKEEVPRESPRYTKPGLVMVEFAADREYYFNIKLKNSLVTHLMVEDRKYGCNGGYVEEITVEVINDCLKGYMEIIPNTKKIRP